VFSGEMGGGGGRGLRGQQRLDLVQQICVEMGQYFQVGGLKGGGVR
jgi:hypothetical protein